uniref:protein phosphatase 1F-like n=1 Tax=Pristiophorus japonicus TaxID=55135 RepID=UPI00398E67C8
MSVAPEKSGAAAEEEEEKETLLLLDALVQEFPAPLGPGTSLPVRLQSAMLSREEVEGESADMGLKLLRDRNLPPVLAATLIHAAIAHVLQLDISLFRNKKEPDQVEEELVCALTRTSNQTQDLPDCAAQGGCLYSLGYILK